jgi:ferric-dicitrate binding protein FerR (iron transport regulator)
VSSEPNVRDLLAPLTDDEEPSSRRLQLNRDKIVSRMVEVSLAPEPRFSRQVKWAMALALAASFALAAWGGLSALRGEVATALPEVKVRALRGVVVANGHSLPIRQDLVVSRDGLLETSKQAAARIESDGMELELQENSTVSLKELGVSRTAAALRLDRGRVRCAIPHDPSRVFSVVTADARIVDVGTVFSVSVVPSETGAKTLVQVEEGEVMVEHAGKQVRLRAPASWSSLVEAEPVALEPPTSSSAEVEPASPVSQRRDTPAGKKRRDTLDAETQLLQAGLASEQRGDYRGAVRDLEQLVKRYPGSPLAPDARAALARVKGRLESPK